MTCFMVECKAGVAPPVGLPDTVKLSSLQVLNQPVVVGVMFPGVAKAHEAVRVLGSKPQ